MSNSMGIRTFYETETGQKIPKDYEVHHIDHDRNNNHIHNLVAIPKEVHRQYHHLFSEIAHYEDRSFLTPVSDSFAYGCGITHFDRIRLKHIQGLLDVKDDIFAYVVNRDIMLGVAPLILKDWCNMTYEKIKEYGD